MLNVRKMVGAPAAWWDAFDEAAKRAGYKSTGQWLAECGRRVLPPAVQNKLPEFSRPGKRAKASTERPRPEG